MIITAALIFSFTLIRLVVVLANYLADNYLPRSDKDYNKLVSVLIPARNEEANIRNILNDLKIQSYRNIEVIIFNDQSDDNTEDIVTEYTKSDNRFSLVNSGSLPEGWYGKNYACHCLAERASGEYLLFLDADVRISGRLIADTISLAERKKPGLISVFPEQEIVSAGEAMTVPDMNFILLSLLPLSLVGKSSYPSLAAANGQFMFFDAEVYRKTRPHEKMKAEKVEDIETARFFKRNDIRVECLLGDERIRCRMYKGFSDAVNGFSKNVFSFFGNSFILALLFWLVTSLGFLVIIYYMPVLFAIIYILAGLTIRILVSLASRQSVFKNLIYLLPLQLSLGLFIYKAFLNRYFRSFEWKGRKIH